MFRFDVNFSVTWAVVEFQKQISTISIINGEARHYRLLTAVSSICSFWTPTRVSGSHDPIISFYWKSLSIHLYEACFRKFERLIREHQNGSLYTWDVFVSPDQNLVAVDVLFESDSYLTRNSYSILENLRVDLCPAKIWLLREYEESRRQLIFKTAVNLEEFRSLIFQ